jgi:hypothetical protein
MNARRLMMGLGLLVLATGCSSGRYIREAVPPRVELREYRTVGLVRFTCNERGDLDGLSTQRFLRAVQAAQPGTRVIELGSDRRVLGSVGRRSWDRDTLRAVREQHGVDAVIVGHVQVERSRPDVAFSTYDVKRVNVSQDVNVELTARLMETRSGATIWTDGAKAVTNLAHGSISDRGHGHFGMSNPEASYGEMLDGLVWNVTDAFRVHYITRRIPKTAPSRPVPLAEPAPAPVIAPVATARPEPRVEVKTSPAVVDVEVGEELLDEELLDPTE